MCGPKAGGKGAFQLCRKLEASEGTMDVGVVDTATGVLKANPQLVAIGGQRCERETPALRFCQAFTQLTLIADFNPSRFQ